MRVIGVDPGSRFTGYGCVEIQGNQLQHISHGTLRLSRSGGPSSQPLEQRLLTLNEALSALISRYQPQTLVVEKVFLARNPLSALKLGQARGVVLCCAAFHGLEVVEY